MLLTLGAFDGDFIGNTRDDDLPGFEISRTVHGEQVAVEDARVAHAFALDGEQIVRVRLEHARIDIVMGSNVFGGQQRRAGSHAPDQRNARRLQNADAA